MCDVAYYNSNVEFDKNLRGWREVSQQEIDEHNLVPFCAYCGAMKLRADERCIYCRARKTITRHPLANRRCPR
jgi:hypothetical protein